jgi:hypothetical protein
MTQTAGRIMLDRVARSLSFANVTSVLALFVALGGTAWALQANSVTSRHIVDGTIRSVDVKDGAGVRGVDVVDASLTGAELASASLTGADIDEQSLGVGAAYSERTSSLRLMSSFQTAISRTVTVSAPTQLSPSPRSRWRPTPSSTATTTRRARSRWTACTGAPSTPKRRRAGLRHVLHHVRADGVPGRAHGGAAVPEVPRSEQLRQRRDDRPRRPARVTRRC